MAMAMIFCITTQVYANIARQVSGLKYVFALFSSCEGVLDCKFHPRQPWLFTAGADSMIRLYCE